MIEFIKKIKNHGIKIARVNLILIIKSINLQLFTLILYTVGVRCDRRRFSVLSPFIIIIIIIIKKGRQCKAEREWCTVLYTLRESDVENTWLSNSDCYIYQQFYRN